MIDTALFVLQQFECCKFSDIQPIYIDTLTDQQIIDIEITLPKVNSDLKEFEGFTWSIQIMLITQFTIFILFTYFNLVGAPVTKSK